MSLLSLQADKRMKAAAQGEAERLQQVLVEACERANDLEAKLQNEEDARKTQVAFAAAMSADTPNGKCVLGAGPQSWSSCCA